MGAAAAAGIGAVGAIGAGAMGASAAQSGAKAQADAANNAAMLQKAQYDQTRSDLMPFMTAGTNVLPDLSAYQPAAQNRLQTAIDQTNANIPGVNGGMTTEWLRSQPGYQWNLSQGEKALNNSAAARGLGLGSGAALKGAAQWATGLADNTYQTAWNTAQQRWADMNQNVSNIYNMNQQGYNQLYSLADLGENAAAKSGTIGQAGAAAAGGNIAAAGQAIAAGDSAAAKNISGAITGAANAPLNYLTYQKLYGGGSGGYAGNPPVNAPQTGGDGTTEF